MSTTLFPPVVEVNQNTQILNSENYYIYFALSQFNTLSDISAIQITARKQSNNNSIFNKNKVHYEIYQYQKISDLNKLNNGFYRLPISKDFFISLQANTNYKIQIRFVSGSSIPDYNSDTFPNWIAQHQGNLSEWSEVSLLMLTSAPTISMSFPSGTTNEVGVYQSRILNFYINITYTNQKDKIEKYKIYLSNSIQDKDWQFFDIKDNARTSIYKSFPQTLTNNFTYYVKMKYITHLGYENTVSLGQVIVKYGKDYTYSGITTECLPDLDKGRVQVKIKGLKTATDFIVDNLIQVQILRTTNHSAYKNWELVRDCVINLSANAEDIFIWEDYTVPGSIWCKYGYILIKPNTTMQSTLCDLGRPVLCYFEDMYLDNINSHLRIRLDQDVSNYKYIVNEQITNTLGNQYPTITRSGKTKYRQFSISGTICAEDNRFENDIGITYMTSSALMHNELEKKTWDEKGVIDTSNYTILSEQSLINKTKGLYNYYQTQYLTPYRIQNNVNNYIYEKEYRDKIISILYKNDVKLLRTLTEGNIIVKLTNISLTPNKELSRMIWSFSATATEIADDTIENYNKYNILETDKVTGHLEYQLRISDSEIDNTPAYNSNSVLTKEIENTDHLKLYLTWVED